MASDYDLLRVKIRIDEEVEGALIRAIDHGSVLLEFVELNERGLIVKARGVTVVYTAADYGWQED